MAAKIAVSDNIGGKVTLDRFVDQTNPDLDDIRKDPLQRLAILERDFAILLRQMQMYGAPIPPELLGRLS